MPRLPQKAKFQCPCCGFSQLEPPHLISTYCQSCGEYYEVRACAPSKLPPLPPAPPASEKRAVLCHRCGNTHGVSPHAVNTLCPGCNAAIELGDITILTSASCRVDTRGKLTIGASGSLSSSWMVCGSADIQGRIVGVLRSEGEVHLSTSRICACQITAPSVFIEKNARASFTLPLETGHLEVRGHLTGIVHCRGIVHVRRGGRLEAEVHARSVRVEKGGALLGTCHVDCTQPDEPAKAAASIRDETLWSGQMAAAVPA
ncbi:MAG: polymer-forming cytoskeletal protein [Verrucomicrobia bacterium]|nr:polymer-forming cytoskeletal protein [Verrucomicrobiota bacterium]